MNTIATAPAFTIENDPRNPGRFRAVIGEDVLTDNEVSEYKARRRAEGVLVKRKVDAMIAEARQRLIDGVKAKRPEIAFEGNSARATIDGINAYVSFGLTAVQKDWAYTGQVRGNVGCYGESAQFPPTKTGGPNVDKMIEKVIDRVDAEIARSKREREVVAKRRANASAVEQIEAHARVKVESSQYGVSVAVHNVKPELAAKLAAAMSAILAAEGV